MRPNQQNKELVTTVMKVKLPEEKKNLKKKSENVSKKDWGIGDIYMKKTIILKWIF